MPTTTMVFAENLSVEAIVAGINEGRTVVKVDGVDGPMLETELTGERVGDTVFGDRSTLSAVVTGGEGLTLKADVADPDQAQALVAAVEERWGRVDALVHAAAIPGADARPGGDCK